MLWKHIRIWCRRHGRDAGRLLSKKDNKPLAISILFQHDRGRCPGRLCHLYRARKKTEPALGLSCLLSRESSENSLSAGRRKTFSEKNHQLLSLPNEQSASGIMYKIAAILAVSPIKLNYNPKPKTRTEIHGIHPSNSTIVFHRQINKLSNLQMPL